MDIWICNFSYKPKSIHIMLLICDKVYIYTILREFTTFTAMLDSNIYKNKLLKYAKSYKSMKLYKYYTSSHTKNTSRYE